MNVGSEALFLKWQNPLETMSSLLMFTLLLTRRIATLDRFHHIHRYSQSSSNVNVSVHFWYGTELY